MRNSNLPAFYNYDSEGGKDAGYEALQDFFLSWTLRCAAAEPSDEPGKRVKEYARRMVYFLIHGKFGEAHYQWPDANLPPDEFAVTAVSTKRNIGNIDLVAEVATLEGAEETQYVFSIENKWYTGLRAGQLQQYSIAIANAYPDARNIIKLLITCDGCRGKRLASEAETCLATDYKFLNVDNIIEYMHIDGEPTGNALFDAYWLK